MGADLDVSHRLVRSRVKGEIIRLIQSMYYEYDEVA